MSRRIVAEAVAVVLLLSCFAGAALYEIANTSPTYDEPAHIAAGYSYARYGDYRLNPEHPPLVKRVAALATGPLDESANELARYWEAALAFPPAQWRYAHELLYGMRPAALARLGRPTTDRVEGTAAVTRADFLNDAEGVVARARRMMVPFGLLLGLLIYLWSRELFGTAGALLSLALFVAEPSLVAHGSLVTTDVPIALCLFGSTYFFWRATERFSWPSAVAFALFSAAAFLVKFSAVVLVPLLAVLALLRRTRVAFALVGAAALTAYVGIWAAYGWRYSAAADPAATAAAEAKHPAPRLPDRVPGHFPLEYSLRRHAADSRFFAEHRRPPTEEESRSALQYASVRGMGKVLLALDRMHLLPEAYLYGAAFVRERSLFRAAYLRGEYSDVGFPSYFFWTFVLKTPVAALVLIVCALVAVLRTPAHRRRLRFVWIPVVIYLLVVVRANLNIGHRHLLPLYPFLFLLCGVLAARWLRFAARTRIAAAAAVLLLLAYTGLQPNRLSYVNELGGGPANGYRHLADSNYDWGQDLVKLRRWLEREKVSEPINLCYFGTADPRYYGIRHHNLFLGYEYEPKDGLRAAVPGLLAVSATNLTGNYWTAEAREEWRAFMARTGAKEVGRAGRSILIYRLSGVPAGAE
ncbi:MAG TPA: glycosyltransferase family 39 protein [Thermoanaerobaculia bacterium]|jgi:4-amino-4-deoxy-L-arabinose transferase-like glycosyltransferase